MRSIATAVAVAGVALALGAVSPAGAAQVGECPPQEEGAYSDTICRAPSAGGNHEWQELRAANSRYTDGHPEVLYDERQVFSGKGVELMCRGQVVVGQTTSFTANAQVAQDNKCELLEPERLKCGNTLADGVPNNIYTSESGRFVDGPEGTVRNRLSLSATFTCGKLEASLSGNYEGQVGYRLDDPEHSVLETPIHKYALLVGPGFGAQALTLTVGLESWRVTLTGEQEDKYGTKYLIVRP